MPAFRRSRPSSIEPVNPLTRVSEHFLLSDFLGNTSIYNKGYKNSLLRDPASLRKMDNLGALCRLGLEPILATWGPLTVSYGYISPELSRAIITYQDPDKPSHHRFDLGAAADICVHRWVDKSHIHLEDLFLPESVRGAPIALAHAIDMENIPYSRLITYSESPYICLAVSSDEVGRNSPRKAFYENRYTGTPKAKPQYRQLSTQQARQAHFQALQERGLEFPWEGSGYPTYHGGGRRQYQHMRVSKYTMVSDWLLDLQSIASGAPNVPDLRDDQVLDSFAAAGIVYDKMLTVLSLARMSIVGGYVSRSSPYATKDNDWTRGVITARVVPPASLPAREFAFKVNHDLPDGVEARQEGTSEVVELSIETETVLGSRDWD